MSDLGEKAWQERQNVSDWQAYAHRLEKKLAAKGDGPTDTRPYLTIPYWTTPLAPGGPVDDGEDRPLPSSVASYLCPSIIASPYVPGSDLTVQVDVRNQGGGNTDSLATVTVWWTQPGPSFGALGANNLVGVGLVNVAPRGGLATTNPLTKLIPSTAPDHICLLAQVSASLDPAGPVPDPIGDRHWAQRNLWTIKAQQGQIVHLNFWAANPFNEEAAFSFRVMPAAREHFYQIARANIGDPILTEAKIKFRTPATVLLQRIEESESPSIVALGPRASRSVLLSLELATVPTKGQFAVFEILQFHGKSDKVVGSAGVIVLPPD
jgi:hypothetical protein